MVAKLSRFGWRAGLWALPLLTLCFLIASLGIQRSRQESGVLFQELIASGEVVALETFRAEFRSCRGERGRLLCDTLLDTLAGTPERNARRVRRLLPLVPLGFVAYALVSSEAWVRGDMIADGLGAGGASVVLLGALLMALMRSLRNLPPSPSDVKDEGSAILTASPTASPTLSVAERSRTRLERLSERASLALGCVVLGLLAYANVTEIAETGAKSLIDWKYALFYPGMLLLAFARVGASSRIIEALASDLTRKRVLEAELRTAKRQMKANQGPSRGPGADRDSGRPLLRGFSLFNPSWQGLFKGWRVSQSPEQSNPLEEVRLLELTGKRLVGFMLKTGGFNDVEKADDELRVAFEGTGTPEQKGFAARSEPWLQDAVPLQKEQKRNNS